MNNIPVFDAVIDGTECGIYRISLVDLPAVESDFVYFNKEREVKFSIQDAEQRMITGVIMRAGFPIYRFDPQFGEYYIRYSAETIKVMAEKMMIDNTFNQINLMHVDGTDVEGVNLVEIFIKDSEKGINPAGFEDVEDGSLFATYKINNEAVWEEIKAGTFRGFSLEGLFDLDRVELSKQFKNKNTFLDTMTRLFNRFLKSFVKCGSVETDKGAMYWVGEADLQIGDELFYNTENEEAVKVEDGEYRLEDGTVIVVKEGLVSEIREKDGEQEGELDMQEEEKKVECEEEVIVEEEPAEETVVDEPKDDRYDALKADIDDLRKEHDELRGMYEDMKNTLEALLSKPAAEPIVEEFNKVSAKTNGGIPAFGSRSKTFK